MKCDLHRVPRPAVCPDCARDVGPAVRLEDVDRGRFRIIRGERRILLVEENIQWKKQSYRSGS